MSKDQQAQIASRGGRAAQVNGTAHRWTQEEARVAGAKGGSAKARERDRLRRRAQEEAQALARLEGQVP